MTARPTIFRIATFAILVTLGLASSAAAQTTVYVVRHAEKKEAPGDRDPSLSEAGRKRAQTLARTLRSVKLGSAWATQYKRTQQTVAPAAKAKEMKTSPYDAARSVQLGARLKRENPGGAVLVAGHSNTVPLVLKGLGVTAKIKLTEEDYDDLFVVFLDKEGHATLQHLHYGEPAAPSSR